MNIGIIGFGKMGEAIAQGLLQSKNSKMFKIQGTTHSESSAKEVSKRLGLKCHTDNLKLASTSDVIILCVKPYQAEKVLHVISKALKKNKILISVCASLTTKQLSKWAGGKVQVVRAMPNTPSLIGKGMTVLCSDQDKDTRHLDVARDIFDTVGKTVVIEEALMDGATGLSGCGPAYGYLIIEALSEAGVKVGISRQTATLLAAQTLAGAAEMVLQRGNHPAALKDEVTTPAGCTIDGLMALEEGKLRVTLIKAVLAAAKRSQNMRIMEQSK